MTKNVKIPSVKELAYRSALIAIACHYEFCDVFRDKSAMYVLRRACEALGVKIDKDEFGQVELKWPDKNTPQVWPGDGRGKRPTHT